MKKILIASSLAVLSGSAAAGAFNYSATAGSSTPVTTGQCTLLQSDIKVNSSAANVGSWDCNTSTSSIGVSFGNTSGKNKTYSASSAGGGLVEATYTAAVSTTQTNAGATTASASS